MSKLLNVYRNDIDKAWYDSSNILYSECDDKENELKEVRVVFKNGTQYKYKDVNVHDYLMFREDASQGKALNKFIKQKGYEYEKMENVNLDEIAEELKFRSDGGIYVEWNDNGLEIVNGNGNSLMKYEDSVDESMAEYTKNVCLALGHNTVITKVS